MSEIQYLDWNYKSAFGRGRPRPQTAKLVFYFQESSELFIHNSLLLFVFHLGLQRVQKTGATLLLPLTLPNSNRFSNFFHRQT